jgi:hypothetical protein
MIFFSFLRKKLHAPNHNNKKTEPPTSRQAGCIEICDQIWRFFAYCVILGNYRSSQIFRATIFSGKNYVLILTRNGLGYILGNFFKNSSGHPV